MLSPIAESKVSPQLFANEIAKAQALIVTGMLVPEGTGYTKKVGGWHVDLNTQTCDCPAYMGRLETARRIEDLHVGDPLGHGSPAEAGPAPVQYALALPRRNLQAPTCKPGPGRPDQR